MPGIRVLLVDDQELIRTGFSLVLSAEADVTVVGEAADGIAALEWLESNAGEVDVILMDVRMPGKNGIETTAEVVRRYPGARVLVLTTFDLDEYAMLAIEAGAAGFLLKDARPTELVDAIRRVHQGDAVMAPGMTVRIIDHLRDSLKQESQNQQNQQRAATLDLLTEREREVFECIARGANNTEIAQTMFLSESTVKTHVGRIFQKLELRDRVHAVLLAKDLGL